MIAWADEIDPHYAKLWLDCFSGMLERGVLDERTRTLIVIGQFVVMNEMEQLGIHIRSALANGATPREALEVILMSTIYSGMPRFVRLIAILERALEEQGRLAELADTQRPIQA